MLSIDTPCAAHFLRTKWVFLNDNVGPVNFPKVFIFHVRVLSSLSTYGPLSTETCKLSIRERTGCYCWSQVVFCYVVFANKQFTSLCKSDGVGVC